MNDYEYKFNKILDFENEELLKYKVPDTGTPLWLFVRTLVLQNATWDSEEWIPYLAEEPFVHDQFIKEKVIHNPFLTRQKDILFAFFSNKVFVKNQDGKVVEDKFFPFMTLFKNKSTSLVSFRVANEFGLNCDYPNWKSDYVFFDVFKSPGNGSVDEEGIREFINYVRKRFPYNVITRDVARSMMKTLYEVEMYQADMIKALSRYLDRIRPKVVFVHWAHYGELLKTALMYACEEKGITTAEFQPNVYNLNKPGCNFGKTIISDIDCKRVLPDYVLTRGEFWTNYCRIPGKVFVVGSPYLSSVESNPNNNNILFAAGLDYKRYHDFLDDLFDKGHNLNFFIYFRMHPGLIEEHIEETFAQYESTGKFELANDRSLSFYLNKCSYVISDGGTVLYEALTYGRKVIAIRNEFCNKMAVDRVPDVEIIDDVEDFVEFWNSSSRREFVCHSEMCETDWERKYVDFLGMVGVL